MKFKGLFLQSFREERKKERNKGIDYHTRRSAAWIEFKVECSKKKKQFERRKRMKQENENDILWIWQLSQHFETKME